MIMILHHLKLHICWKYAEKYATYAAYMRRIFRQILHIFPYILPQKVSHILRKFSAINQHPSKPAGFWILTGQSS